MIIISYYLKAMKFKNLKIRTKLMLSFGLVVVIFAGTSGYLLYKLSGLDDLQKISEQRSEEGIKISENSDIGANTYVVIANAIINRNQLETEKDWQELTKENDQVFDELYKIVETDEEKRLLEETKADYSDIVNKFENEIKPDLFGSNSNDQEAEEQIREDDAKIDKDIDKIEHSLNGISDSIVSKNKQANVVFRQEASQILDTSVILLLVVIVLSIVMIYLLVNIIVRPVVKGVEFATLVSKGDLTARVDIDQHDEIGKLAKSLSDMVLRLSDIVGSIRESSDNINTSGSEIQTASEQLSSSAEQMSSSTQQVSQGASEQASSTEEISSSMEEMAANIQQNTENAQETEKIAIKASSEIETVMDKSKESLENIVNISNRISIISEIANQTNILALNAAVEAARAGEHGKGFAVVAAEVRKLAERSKIAADEINDLSGISVSTTQEAGKMLEAIIPDIRKTAQLVQEISAASIEQNSGASQINNAIQQLNTVTQQNASVSEEIATSSEELSSTAEEMSNNADNLLVQAENLKSIMEFFKLDSRYIKTSTATSVRQSRPVQAVKKPVHPNVNAVSESKKQKKQAQGVNITLTEGQAKEEDFESF